MFPSMLEKSTATRDVFAQPQETPRAAHAHHQGAKWGCALGLPGTVFKEKSHTYLDVEKMVQGALQPLHFGTLETYILIDLAIFLI